jgi:hypothetical protein
MDTKFDQLKYVIDKQIILLPLHAIHCTFEFISCIRKHVRNQGALILNIQAIVATRQFKN